MAENKPILGELLGGGEERDAIHIAIMPARACDYIGAGAHIRVDARGEARLDGASPNAVADPFLRHQIYPGQKFYALLFPYTIESLRHEWVHRDFPLPESDNRHLSEQWLRTFAEDHYVDYGEMMEAADDLMNGHSSDMDICFGEDVDYSERQDFWNHYSVVRGKVVTDDIREEYFRCAC